MNLAASHPISLIIMYLDNPKPIKWIPNYTGYIPHRKEFIAIERETYKITNKYLAFNDSSLTEVILEVIQVS